MSAFHYYILDKNFEERSGDRHFLNFSRIQFDRDESFRDFMFPEKISSERVLNQIIESSQNDILTDVLDLIEKILELILFFGKKNFLMVLQGAEILCWRESCQKYLVKTFCAAGVSQQTLVDRISAVGIIQLEIKVAVKL